MAPVGVATPSVGGATPIGTIGAIGAPQGPPKQDIQADVFLNVVLRRALRRALGPSARQLAFSGKIWFKRVISCVNGGGPTAALYVN